VKDTDLFDAIPLPATLLDPQGVILEVNQAFLDYARGLGYEIAREDRISHPLVNFAATEQVGTHLQTIIDRTARTGETSQCRERFTAASGRAVYQDIRAKAVKDANGRVTGVLLLREDVTEKVFQERRRQVVSRVRDEVWKMQTSQDTEQVLIAVRDGLQELEVSFSNCGLNLVDATTDPPTVRFHSMTREGQWLQSRSDDPGAEVVLRIWRARSVAYRKDLEAEDVHGEKGAIDADFDQPIRSVVDVPFSRGTLAINSVRPDAFQEEDIEVFQEMAQVLSESFARMADFQELEQRNQELEREITERQQAEEALRESEFQYRTSLDSMSDMIHVVDADLRFLLCNVAFEKINRELSLPTDVIGKTILEVFPFLPEKVREEYERVLSSGETLITEETTTVAGQEFITETRKIPVFEGGKVVRVMTIIRDITEPKRQVTQRETLHRLREEVGQMQGPEDIERVLEAIGSSLETVGIPFLEYGINVIDPSSDPPGVRFNTRTRGGEWKIEGSSREFVTCALERIWRSGEVFYRPDLEKEDEHGIRENLERRAGAPVRAVIDVPFSHGTLAVNSSQENAFSERDIAFLQEVAEVLSEGFRRMDDLQQLARSETRYRTLVETPDLAVILMGLDGRYLYVSPQIEKWTGYTPEEFYADKEIGRRLLHPDDFATMDGMIRRAAQEKSATQGEFRWRGRDQEEYRWASEFVFPVRGPGEEIEALQAVIQDITARKQLEEQLLQSQKMEAVGELTAGIAHNFNNLLQGIMGNIQLALMDAPLSLEPLLRDAESTGQRAADMVRQLMVFARRQDADRHWTVELPTIVQDTVAICRKTFDRKIETTAELSVHLPLIQGDARQLQQALLHLCLNARDALEAGGQSFCRIQIAAETIHLKPEDLSARPQARPGPYVWLRVRDNGTGMDAETQQRAFEPFFTTKDVGKGTGLGLATVYAIVQEHGGWIDCESAPGAGTTFSIYLPAAEEETVDAAVPAADQMQGGEETVLLIDDEEIVQKTTARLLERHGYTVLVGADGEEGLEIFRREQERISLVLLDLSMPRMSGEEVLAKLRALAPEIPVILFTGYAVNGAFWKGIQGIIQKPVQWHELLRIVGQALDG